MPFSPGKTPEQKTQDRHNLMALYNLPIYRLPTEILVQILALVPMEDYPALIVAAMPLLRRCGIASDVTTAQLRALLMASRRLNCDDLTNASSVLNTSMRQILRLPVELRWSIIGHLRFADRMNLVLAIYPFSADEIEHLTHQEVKRQV